MKTMLCEHRQFTCFVTLAACALAIHALPATALPMSAADFNAVAGRCAVSVPAGTLAAIARMESGIDPWVLHDNTTGDTIRQNALINAQMEANKLISRGDSVDIGLMQINSANLSALGISTKDALNPCVSLAAGAAVLRAGYSGTSPSSDQTVDLLLALSRYNTGTPFKGIMNGYAHTVEQDAEMNSPSLTNTSVAQTIGPNAPPAWNLWASAAYARAHGASWLVTSNADPGQP